MASEYDPVLSSARRNVDSSHLDVVRDLFQQASMPYMSSPLAWFAWAVIMPVAALATPAIANVYGPLAVLLLWSIAILLGGAFEMLTLRRSRRGSSSPLASWAFGVQANLSLVAIALSLFLVWQGRESALPGLWLLVLGHSFVSLGGLSFHPLRQTGLIYQLGGVVALWPSGDPLMVLAMTTFFANAWMGLSISRRRAASR
jgi:hypothetical protein